MKIILKVPGYSDTTFDSYENLNFIWEVLENYPNAKLEIVADKEEVIDNTDKNVEVNETIENISDTEDKDTKQVTLKYVVPKQVTFTQRFQDRINTDVTDILDQVYPGYFTVDNIKFEDITDNIDNMNVYITILSLSDNAIDSVKYLDKNVEYIIKDLVDYYTK